MADQFRPMVLFPLPMAFLQQAKKARGGEILGTQERGALSISSSHRGRHAHAERGEMQQASKQAPSPREQNGPQLLDTEITCDEALLSLAACSILAALPGE